MTNSPAGKEKRPSSGGFPYVANARKYGVFVLVLLAAAGIIILTKNLLLAPPYAVSIYLTVFDHHSRYARPISIASSYTVVIASSAVLQLVLGTTALALVVNVVVVSAFISFTPYTHPPAIALTLFSYLVHDIWSFTTTSLVVLSIVVLADVALDRTDLLHDRAMEREEGQGTRKEDPAPFKG